jgi:hypothetical protein
MRQNRVLEKADNTGLQCDCGATCVKSEEKRFRQRHPALCNERKSFAHQLAQTTKCVDGDEEVTDSVLEFIANLNVSQLTEWEAGFIENISGRSLSSLSNKQKACIMRIHKRLSV